MTPARYHLLRHTPPHYNHRNHHHHHYDYGHVYDRNYDNARDVCVHDCAHYDDDYTHY